jgi:predicted esterase
LRRVAAAVTMSESLPASRDPAMRIAFAALFLLASAPFASAQSREAVLVFKDGYVLKGKAVQQKDFIVDPATGTSFTIPKSGSFLHFDDGPRKIFFSPAQVREVIPLKPGELTKDQLVISRTSAGNRGGAMMPNWTFEGVTDWDDSLQRTFKVSFEDGKKIGLVTQRLIYLTPQRAVIETLKYDWTIHLQTKELGGEHVRSILYKHFAKQKEMKDVDRRYQIARFLMQAGFYPESEKELENLVKEFPDSKEMVQNLQIAIRKTRVNQFAEEIERSAKTGQHQEAQERIKLYDREKYDELANEKYAPIIHELKNKYEALGEKLKNAKELLDGIAAKLSTKSPWAGALEAIGEGLNFDTVERVDTFLTYAQQHLRELKENRKPTQSAEEVLSLAVTGWLHGNAAAEADPKMATNLWRARDLALYYLKTDDQPAREQAVASFVKQVDMPLDHYARMIKMMPPPMPADVKKLGTEQNELQIELPEGEKGSYLVQLPPDYHHNRSYPVLFLLHGREKANILMQRWQEAAWRNGWIMVAPKWGSGFSSTYGHTARENQLVIDVLRDARRKFNIDSDRVYLFGWDEGGSMAYDVGLMNPGMFAAVSVMCGDPKGFANRCGTNAQYLPFYVIDGSNNGAMVKNNEVHCGEWVKKHFASIFVEYKGRANEWYVGEVDNVADWFSRKKRAHPSKQLGVPGGEEFKTNRETDNRFYWVGVSGIADQNLNDWKNWIHTNLPANVQVDVAHGNEASGKDAKIYTQLTIRSKGVNKVHLWLSPEVVDFSKPIQFRVNGSMVRLARPVQPTLQTMLEEIYATGDRQYLFYAKVALSAR